MSYAQRMSPETWDYLIDVSLPESTAYQAQQNYYPGTFVE
jgi:hypothetical protein